MKIRLTESQYKRILKEGDDFASIGNHISRNIIGLFKYFDNNYTSEDIILNPEEILSDIKQILGVSDNTSKILLHNYQKKWLKGDKNVDRLLGEPLEWVGTYLIRVGLPTEVTTRTYIPGFVEVTASSPEEAIENASVGLYNDMFFDETSEEYRDPDLDYDLDSDAKIQEDMVLDYVRDISFDEIKDFIKLKK
jgi:hypothetical protein